jgi:antitoxin component YwqK of YwqJK toxin-antitoxin module
MIRYIPFLIPFIFVFLSCDNDEKIAEDPGYCDCEMLAIDNLYNHFYLEDRNEPYTGICKVFHNNGQLKREQEIVDGKNNGYFRVYSESGVLLEEGNFKNNRHHGTFKYFDDKGNLTLEAEYENGVRKVDNESAE